MRAKVRNPWNGRDRKTHNYIVTLKSKSPQHFLLLTLTGFHTGSIDDRSARQKIRVIVCVRLDPGDGGAREKKVLNALQHETTAHQG